VAEDPAGVVWILTRRALAEVSTDPVAREVLAAGRIFGIMGAGQAPVEGIEIVPTASFGSYRELARASGTGNLPPGTAALLYDPEHWAFTPANEQADPGGFVRRALQVARLIDMTLIAAPAVTLTAVVGRPRADRYHAYLDAGIATMAAPADVVDIQAQNAVRDTGRYVAFVAAACAQVRAANPQAVVLAGLSTNPPGEPVDEGMLTRAILATRSLVDGYWLNIPSPGPHCPTCNAPRPDIGIAALRAAFA
jgi:hypothetical protein